MGGVKLAVIVTHIVLFLKKKTSNFLLEGANHQKSNNKKSIYHIVWIKMGQMRLNVFMFYNQSFIAYSMETTHVLSSELSANHHHLELRIFPVCLGDIKEAGVEKRCEGCRAFNRTYRCYGRYYIKLEISCTPLVTY